MNWLCLAGRGLSGHGVARPGLACFLLPAGRGQAGPGAAGRVLARLGFPYSGRDPARFGRLGGAGQGMASLGMASLLRPGHGTAGFVAAWQASAWRGSPILGLVCCGSWSGLHGWAGYGSVRLP